MIDYGRIYQRRRPLELLDNVAEDIPLDNNSVDSVVITFTMCSIEHIESALHEARRVLKSNGQLLFCEHGLAPDHKVQRWQNRLNPMWKKLAGGCHLDRDITSLVQQNGFSLDTVEQTYMKGPKAFSFIYKGNAKPN